MLAGFLNNISGGAGQENIDTLMSNITQSTTPAGLTQLAVYLKSKENWLSKSANKTALGQQLETLDPSTHSLGYLYLL